MKVTKDLIEQSFIEYNKLYFGNKFPKTKFYILMKKRPFGMCIRGKGECEIWISKFITDEKFFKNILIHEMIHQYVYQILHGFTYTIIQHGLLFHYVRWKLTRKYHLEIRPN